MLVYVYVFIGKSPNVITPIVVRVGLVQMHYIEFKCLSSLDLKIHV